MSTQEFHEAVFNHPKNIYEGLGRIIYTDGGYGYPPSWVLPGGERTQDERRAREAALWIDSVTPRKDSNQLSSNP